MLRYKVTLTEDERKELTKNYTKGKHSAHAVLSARALVLLDAGDGGPAKSNKEVSEATGLSEYTVRRKFTGWNGRLIAVEVIARQIVG